jgi:glutamine synthetase
VKEMLTENKDIMFNGDGYSQEWQNQIAPSRGLQTLKTTADALPTLVSEKNKDLLEKTGVLQRHEVDARSAVLYDKYTNTVLIEANCLLNMMRTGVESACLKDLRTYEGSIHHSERSSFYESVFNSVNALAAKIENFPEDSDFNTQARYCCDNILPMMKRVREKADEAESLVDGSLWPYPTYQEILFRGMKPGVPTSNTNLQQKLEKKASATMM